MAKSALRAGDLLLGEPGDDRPGGCQMLLRGTIELGDEACAEAREAGLSQDPECCVGRRRLVPITEQHGDVPPHTAPLPHRSIVRRYNSQGARVGGEAPAGPLDVLDTARIAVGRDPPEAVFAFFE